MDFKSEWSKAGYNLEELYFEKVNRELILKLKSQRPAETQEHQEQLAQVIQFRARTVKEEDQEQIKKAA
jgi:hypothetical protein